MAAANETVTRFHRKCHSRVTLSDNNKTAAADYGGTVSCSVPFNHLQNNRFVFKIKQKGPRDYPISYIGVTRSDPGDLEEIPWFAEEVPQMWCVGPDTGERWENSSRVDTGEVTRVTQQEGDVWCVEVTPGGQVYIYHNYNQPWGSPVFTLPPDTTQVWAVGTLWESTISVVQDPDTAPFYDTTLLLLLLLVNKDPDKQCEITRKYITETTPKISKTNPATTLAVYRGVVDFSHHTKVGCKDLRQLLVTGCVIEIIKRLALIVEVPIAELLYPCLEGFNSALSFIFNDQVLFLKWSESYIKSDAEFLLNFLTVINMCAKIQNEQYFPKTDMMVASLINCVAEEKHNGSVNGLDDKGWAPLHYTAHYGWSHATKELLKIPGIDENIKSRAGDTALHLAVKSIPITTRNISSNYADILISLGKHYDTDLQAVDNKGKNAIFLLFTTRLGRCVLDKLIDSGVVNLSWTDNMGRTLVHYNLQNIDELGWKHVRMFVYRILKHNNWTGYKLLSDENTGDVPNSHLAGSDKVSREIKHRHNNLKQSKMRTCEWLLALNDATQIPGHTQQSPVYQRDVTQGIGRRNVCHKCLVENTEIYSIAASYASKAQKVLQDKFPDLQFELQAIGSYIQDLKILRPDEFDFLLILQKTSDVEETMSKDAQRCGATWFAEQSELVQRGEHPDTSITSVYPHGPAWCLELTKKHNDCEVTICVDITLAVRHVGDPMQEYCKKIHGHQYFDYVYDNISEDALFVNLGPDKHGLTTCNIMMKMIARLSYKLPHVASVIRIIKVIVGLMFPKRLVYCEMKNRKIEAKTFFSSHTITTSVLRFLDANLNNVNCWTTDELPATVKAVMKMLRDKLLSFEEDYFPSENTVSEIDTFLFIEKALQKQSWEAEEARHSVDTLKNKFAIAKEGNFFIVRTEQELVDMCRPVNSSVERPRVLAYIIPDHPLLGLHGHGNLSNLMCGFRSYLIDKFKVIPVREQSTKL